MFLKTLYIKNGDEIVREIVFRKGLNLIVDETHTDTLQESGNNVGKTTVLRLIDFCFGSDGKNIYQDPEFKTKSNTQIEDFLKKNNITITLTLKVDLNEQASKEITIRRNFLKYKSKIQDIDGNPYNDRDFEMKLKDLLFNTRVEKPTLRQIIAKNIRDEKNKLINTLKVLHPTTTFEEYEALYFFWFGIETDTAARKQKKYEEKKIEEKIYARLKKESTVSEIEQSLKIIDRDIAELNSAKSNFSINENFENDLKLLNEIKSSINVMTTEIGSLDIRRKLILESKSQLEKEFADIDTTQLNEIYGGAKVYIPDLQTKFEDFLRFHNNMLKETITYVTDELPNLDSRLGFLYRELSVLMAKESEMSIHLKKAGVIEELEEIVQKLNTKFEQKGRYEEQLRQWEKVIKNLAVIDEELKEINDGIASHDDLLNRRIEEFNKFFVKLSERLYAEQFVLSYYKKDERAYDLKIGAIGGNLGTGKKKGQIAAFDFAYIQFCEENDIPCLHFILHDQIENMHDNQIKTLSDVANEINCQYVVPILRDKLPENLSVELYEVISLSQDDKLFKVK